MIEIKFIRHSLISCSPVHTDIRDLTTVNHHQEFSQSHTRGCIILPWAAPSPPGLNDHPNDELSSP